MRATERAADGATVRVDLVVATAPRAYFPGAKLLSGGKPAHPLAWKDTVDVPLEQTVRFVVRFDDRPGTWMYHCHILDHADGGMMGVVQLGVTGGEHHHRPDVP